MQIEVREDSFPMSVRFGDDDAPVAECHIKDCTWQYDADSLNGAVMAWTGHLMRDHAGQARKKDHPLYGRWSMMMSRCYNPKSQRYQRYGARGITVCEQWHDLYAFAAWIETNLGACPPGYSLDRIDNDGSYEPGNVRWATPAEQNWNKGAYASRSGGTMTPSPMVTQR